MTYQSRILVIDDEPGIREAYGKVFDPEVVASFAAESKQPDRMEYDLTVVATGEEGIQAVQEAVDRNNPFAAAFVDMVMPGCDGIETVERIWKIDPKIKVAIVSGHSEYKSAELLDTAAKGDMRFFRKPFTFVEIMQLATYLTQDWWKERRM